MVASPELVLFAIRSAVKLGQQARLAYVDSTRRRAITLPLPSIPPETIGPALTYFDDPDQGRKYVTGYVTERGEEVDGNPILNAIIDRNANGTLTDHDREELLRLYVEFRQLEAIEEGTVEAAAGIGADELNALITIRQWRRGFDPTPSTLHRIAGTLVEIGVDYAATQPDLFDRHSARGQAVLGLLRALQRIDVSEADLSELPAKLFVATLETTAAHPELLSGDEKVRDLVEVIATDLSSAVEGRIRAIDADGSLDAVAKRAARLRVVDWAQLVFRGTLASGAERVLEEPHRFLGVRDAVGGALVSNVGRAVLELVLDDEDGGLDALLGRQGLETILGTALDVVGEHPELLSSVGNAGIRAILAELITELRRPDDPIPPLAFPEIARLVLEATGDNLHLIWPKFAESPKGNLAITAVSTTVRILSQPPADGDRWTPAFGPSDVVIVVEAVLDELVEHPAWITTPTGKISGTLAQALEAVVGVLRARGGTALSPRLGARIVEAAVVAIARRKEFLSTMPGDGDHAGQRIAEAAIDAVLATIFADGLHARAAWQLVRTEVIFGLVDVTLERLAESNLGPAAIAILEAVLAGRVKALAGGGAFDLDDFAQELEAQLLAA